MENIIALIASLKRKDGFADYEKYFDLSTDQLESIVQAFNNVNKGERDADSYNAAVCALIRRGTIRVMKILVQSVEIHGFEWLPSGGSCKILHYLEDCSAGEHGETRREIALEALNKLKESAKILVEGFAKGSFKGSY